MAWLLDVSLLWPKPEASSPQVWGALGAEMTLGSLDLGLKAEACACAVVNVLIALLDPTHVQHEFAQTALRGRRGGSECQH